MKITMNDAKSKEVEAVFLNGRRLVTCIEADDEAGYAIVLIPPPDPAKDSATFNDPSKVTIAEVDPIDEVEWEQKKLEGDVEIVFAKRPGLDDSGL